jgi:hypothetical protein
MESAMVSDQEELPQISLTLAVRNGSVEVEGWIGEKPDQRTPVGAESRDALPPRPRARRLRLLGPVVGRPLASAVPRVDAEIEDVGLGQSEVLQELPGGIGKAGGLDSAQARRYARYRPVETDVSILPSEDFGDVVTKAALGWRKGLQLWWGTHGRSRNASA